MNAKKIASECWLDANTAALFAMPSSPVGMTLLAVIFFLLMYRDRTTKAAS